MYGETQNQRPAFPNGTRRARERNCFIIHNRIHTRSQAQKERAIWYESTQERHVLQTFLFAHFATAHFIDSNGSSASKVPYKFQPLDVIHLEKSQLIPHISSFLFIVVSPLSLICRGAPGTQRKDLFFRWMVSKTWSQGVSVTQVSRRGPGYSDI